MALKSSIGFENFLFLFVLLHFFKKKEEKRRKMPPRRAAAAATAAAAPSELPSPTGRSLRVRKSEALSPPTVLQSPKPRGKAKAAAPPPPVAEDGEGEEDDDDEEMDEDQSEEGDSEGGEGEEDTVGYLGGHSLTMTGSSSSRRKRGLKQGSEELDHPNLSHLSREDRKKEINRLAAKKSREKKLEWLKDLQTVSDAMKDEQRALVIERDSLVQEFRDLERLVANHSKIGCKSTGGPPQPVPTPLVLISSSINLWNLDNAANTSAQAAHPVNGAAHQQQTSLFPLAPIIPPPGVDSPLPANIFTPSAFSLPSPSFFSLPTPTPLMTPPVTSQRKTRASRN